jgi:hypothetical protein
MKSKPNKDTNKENYRLIFLMNIDEKISIKCLQTIQQHIHKIVHHHLWLVSFQRCKNGPTYVNVIQHQQNQEQKSHDHLNTWRKGLLQNSASFHNKISEEIE